MFVCVSRGKKCQFFGKFCVRTNDPLEKQPCPCFIKHRDLELVSCLDSLSEIFQQFLLKIFSNKALSVYSINQKFPIGAIWSYCPHQARPNGVDDIWWSTLTGSNRLWSNGFHFVSGMRIKDIRFSSTSKKLRDNRQHQHLYSLVSKIYQLPPNSTFVLHVKLQRHLMFQLKKYPFVSRSKIPHSAQ